jgi:hypothetical protein
MRLALNAIASLAACAFLLVGSAAGQTGLPPAPEQMPRVATPPLPGIVVTPPRFVPQRPPQASPIEDPQPESCPANSEKLDLIG